MSPWIRHVGAAGVMALIVLTTLRCDVGRELRFNPDRDSVTVRFYFKRWGGMGFDADRLDPEWKSDSTTVRLRSTGRVSVRTHDMFPETYEFEVLRVCSADSIWVHTRALRQADGRWTWKDDPPPDSVLITRRVRWWSTISSDGGTWVGLRMAPESPLPPSAQSSDSTYSVVGRVVDAASGLPCRLPLGHRPGAPTATVHEAWGTASATADSLGYFTLHGLRGGWVKLNTVTPYYSFTSRLVRIPADSVLVRLVRGGPAFFQQVVYEPVAAIPVELRSTHPARPSRVRRPPGIVGLWRGETSCVGSPLDPDCAKERGLFRFTVLKDPSTSGPRVEWRREADEQGPEHTPLERRLSVYWWASAHPTEHGNLGWEFAVMGDTLVGQLIDPYARVVVREFRATRVVR